MLKEIDSWGILTLMTKMKDAYVARLDRERDVLLTFQTQNYEDSPLQNLDKIKVAFLAKYDEEFRKIYYQKEKEYDQKTNGGA